LSSIVGSKGSQRSKKSGNSDGSSDNEKALAAFNEVHGDPASNSTLALVEQHRKNGHPEDEIIFSLLEDKNRHLYWVLLETGNLSHTRFWKPSLDFVGCVARYFKSQLFPTQDQLHFPAGVEVKTGIRSIRKNILKFWIRHLNF
jgi:hypothetical protein